MRISWCNGSSADQETTKRPKNKAKVMVII